jgi:predicted kinase
MPERNLYLVRGVPGAGKTTLVESLAGEGDLVVAADDFMVNSAGHFAFDWQKLQEVHNRCIQAVREGMESGVIRIFVHNSFVNSWQLRPYYDLAATHGYRTFSLVVENRHGHESMHAPQGTTRRMRNKFELSL